MVRFALSAETKSSGGEEVYYAQGKIAYQVMINDVSSSEMGLKTTKDGAITTENINYNHTYAEVD